MPGALHLKYEKENWEWQSNYQRYIIIEVTIDKQLEAMPTRRKNLILNCFTGLLIF